MSRPLIQTGSCTGLSVFEGLCDCTPLRLSLVVSVRARARANISNWTRVITSVSIEKYL